MPDNRAVARVAVLVDGAATAPDDVAGLRDEAGYRVTYLSPRLGRTQVRSKASLLLSMLLPNVARYRRALRDADAAVVYAWNLLPLLVLQRLRLAPRVRMIVSMNLFIQSPRAERLAYRLVGRLQLGNLWVQVSSSEQGLRSQQLMGVPADRVIVLPFRHAGGLPAKAGSDEGYVFTGGYTNRDYDTFVEAVRGLDRRVVVQALPSNEFHMQIPDNVEIDTQFGPEVFERLLSASSLVVLPLNPHGAISGQSVLLQALQYAKPVVATLHPGLVDLLPAGAPGYVPAGDVAAMREAIARGLHDARFRDELVAASRRAQQAIDAWPPIHREISARVEAELGRLAVTA